MTEPIPEPSPRPMPRLGRGGRWSAHLSSPLPPTEPHKPTPRTRPGGWPKTGDVGATAQLAADEEPVTVPARPYGEPTPAPWRTPRYGCWVNPISVPPPAAELRAMADDLNAHGGLDEVFVAELLRQAAADNLTAGSARWQPAREVNNPLDDDPIASARRQLGIVRADEPMPGGILEIRKQLTDAEYEELRAKWEQLHAGGRPVKLEVIRPRPWWRRALDRARRWVR